MAEGSVLAGQYSYIYWARKASKVHVFDPLTKSFQICPLIPGTPCTHVRHISPSFRRDTHFARVIFAIASPTFSVLKIIQSLAGLNIGFRYFASHPRSF